MSLFLLGAGFNVDGAVEAGPVYGNSMYAGRYQIDCGYPLVADVLRLCFHVDEVPPGKSVEDLFAEAIERSDYEPLKRLSDRLMEADFRLAWRIAFDPLNCYGAFFQTFSNSNFITFNYDSLPEIFLFRLRRWYPHDGYGLPVDAELGPLKPSEFVPLQSTSLVLHVHGSLCVYTSEFEIRQDPGEAIPWLHRHGRPRYGFDADSITSCFPPYRRAMSSTGRIPIEERVIAPIPDKAQGLKLPFISETYSKACSLVRDSGTVLAIGYSFNRHDAASYGRILQSLTESHERSLVIVSPDANESATRIHREYPGLRVTPIEKTFNHYAADSFRC